jgi:hypothetical protein
MAKPSKKGAKSEKEVAAEATRKKEILAKVAQSNLPTKTILKELGISRSTYYSWLKRYEEEGDEGLLDSRSLSKSQELEMEAAPAVEEAKAESPEPVEPADVVLKSPEESAAAMVVEEKVAPAPKEPEVKSEATAPPAEEPVRPEEPVTARVKAEPEKEEEKVVTPRMGPPSGGRQKKGMGGYAFLAVVLLVVGLLLSISLSNRNTYKLQQSGDTLTLWKGKFAPRGFELVESFKPVAVGESDVSALTGRTFAGKDEVYKAVFAFFMDQVQEQTAAGNEADISKVNLVLDRAEGFLNGNGKKGGPLSAMQFQLAQKRVAMAELGLHKAYKQALPIYQEALRAGLADGAMLEAKLDTMQKALGLAPVVTPEAPAREAEVTSAEEVQTPAAAETVAPEESVKEVGTAAAGEAPAREAEVKEAGTAAASKPAAGESDTVTTEKATGASGESVKPEEENDKPTNFMEWLRSK